jgi:hypothetical protein
MSDLPVDESKGEFAATEAALPTFPGVHGVCCVRPTD